MSNGAQCCALEICCPPEALRERLPAAIAKFAGIEERHCLAFIEDVLAQNLAFAPKSFDAVASALGAVIHVQYGGEHASDFQRWMEHEELTFAPDEFTQVVRDIVAVVRKNRLA